MTSANKRREEPGKRESKVLERKPYSRPEITELGSLQKFTLMSPSTGLGDSSGPTTWKFD